MPPYFPTPCTALRIVCKYLHLWGKFFIATSDEEPTHKLGDRQVGCADMPTNYDKSLLVAVT